MTRLLTAAVVCVLAAPHGFAQLKPTEVEPGLWRGHAPYQWKHYAELNQMGVRTVLDIRGNQPLASLIEKWRVERMGMVYRKVPFSFHPLRDGSDAAVLAAMSHRGDYPLYVHCNIDRDRTSVAVAAYRVQIQGWSPAAAQAEARSFGLKRYFLSLNRYLQSLGKR